MNGGTGTDMKTDEGIRDRRQKTEDKTRYEEQR
jgi:hypothetical protein